MSQQQSGLVVLGDADAWLQSNLTGSEIQHLYVFSRGLPVIASSLMNCMDRSVSRLGDIVAEMESLPPEDQMDLKHKPSDVEDHYRKIHTEMIEGSAVALQNGFRYVDRLLARAISRLPENLQEDQDQAAVRLRGIFREFSDRLNNFEGSAVVSSDPMTATARLSTVVEPIPQAHRIISHLWQNYNAHVQTLRDEQGLNTTILGDGSVLAMGYGWEVSIKGNEISLMGSNASSPVVVPEILHAIGYSKDKADALASKLLKSFNRSIGFTPLSRDNPAAEVRHAAHEVTGLTPYTSRLTPVDIQKFKTVSSDLSAVVKQGMSGFDEHLAFATESGHLQREIESSRTFGQSLTQSQRAAISALEVIQQAHGDTAQTHLINGAKRARAILEEAYLSLGEKYSPNIRETAAIVPTEKLMQALPHRRALHNEMEQHALDRFLVTRLERLHTFAQPLRSDSYQGLKTVYNYAHLLVQRHQDILADNELWQNRQTAVARVSLASRTGRPDHTLKELLGVPVTRALLPPVNSVTHKE